MQQGFEECPSYNLRRDTLTVLPHPAAPVNSSTGSRAPFKTAWYCIEQDCQNRNSTGYDDVRQRRPTLQERASGYRNEK